MPFIGIPHGNAVAGEGPQFLDQPIIQLLGPFAREKAFGFFAAMDEFGAVTPLGVQGVSQGHTLWVAGVPTRLRPGGLFQSLIRG